MKYLPSTAEKIKKTREDLSASQEGLCKLSGLPLINPALDHDHKTGFVRGSIDSDINVFLGAIENAYNRLPPSIKDVLACPDLTELSSRYMRQTTDILHPMGAKDLIRRFARQKKEHQVSTLEGLKQSGKKILTEDILMCKNSEERTILFEKTIKQNKL